MDNRREYMRHRSRIQHFIKRAEKRGYDFSGFQLPAIPERITKKDVKKLQNLTPEKLYKKAEITEGTNISKRDKTNRKRRKRNDKGPGVAQPPNIADPKNVPDDVYTVLENVEEEIRNFTPKSLWYQTKPHKGKSFVDTKTDEKNRVNAILNGAISQLGREAVAINLSNNASEVNNLIQEILYGSGSVEGNFRNARTQVNFDIIRFSAICYGRPLTLSESIALTESQEENEEYSDES